MTFLRVHAYKVNPQMIREDEYVPEGGEISISNELEILLEDSIKTARFNTRIEVNFIFPDGQIRTNPCRELMMNYCFKDKANAKMASEQLAKKLSKAMNRIKQDCLFIIAAKQDGNKKQITFWSFPADTTFKFNSTPEKINIEVLRDVFSKSSELRKAAMFEGEDLRTEFLSGRILDFQGPVVAKFWYEDFLDCKFAMGSGRGTRCLANSLRETFDKSDTFADREIITSAMLGIRVHHRSEISYGDFADVYLSGKSKDIYKEIIEREHLINSRFIFDIEEFDKAAKFKVFTLDTGAIVYIPFYNFKKAVKIKEIGDGKKYLLCAGNIASETIKMR